VSTIGDSLGLDFGDVDQGQIALRKGFHQLSHTLWAGVGGGF
jgi:hypothetical protein